MITTKNYAIWMRRTLGISIMLKISKTLSVFFLIDFNDLQIYRLFPTTNTDGVLYPILRLDVPHKESTRCQL